MPIRVVRVDGRRAMGVSEVAMRATFPSPLDVSYSEPDHRRTNLNISPAKRLCLWRRTRGNWSLMTLPPIFRAALLVAACGPLASAPLLAQSLTAVQRARIDSVFAPLDGTTRPGCSVGVGQSGVSLYERGYGMSDLQHGIPITPQSIFHVASVSKQFTAFAVGLLAQDGKLSLDDEVRKYITELPDYGKKITLRNLIYHTSGIRDQWELLGMAGWRYPEDLFTQGDVLDIVSRQKELNFVPGDEYLYSNSGYSLLAMIVERVSGKTLRAFADERIFKPLGMTNTHVHDDHAMIVPGRTSAFEGSGNAWKISIPDFDTHGAT
ncbi:MAG: serine hydrolase domain-containing protein, partial [Gemmatimonadaceae bacterium]